MLDIPEIAEWRRQDVIVSGHQPSYLPWMGFFEKIIHCDVFVYHDTAQFEKGGFLHRNKIKTAQGSSWLTVPVDATDYLMRPLNTIQIRQETPWRRKHLKSIATSYARSPFFKRYYPFFEEFYSTPWANLVLMNVAFVDFVIKELDITTRIEFVSGFPELANLHKGDFLVAMCNTFGANRCYMGHHGRDYADPQLFEKAGIRLGFQDFQYPAYDQAFGPFEPNLSIVDVLLNCGPDRTRQLILDGAGRNVW